MIGALDLLVMTTGLVDLRHTRKPCFILTCPAARFMRSRGTNKGGTFL